MNQEFNNGNTTSRFIFSDDFYNQLGGSLDDKKEKDDVVDINVMPIIENENVHPVINEISSNLDDFNNEKKDFDISDNVELENIIIDIPKINMDNKNDIEPIYNNSADENDNQNLNIKEDIIDTPQIVKIEDNIELPTIQMDKELEKEVMKLNAQNQSKPTIVEQGNWYEEPKEKNFYRAVRNQVKSNPINYFNNYNEPTTIEVNPQVMEINKLFKQPPVIDIDELVRQDALIEEKRRKELEKEMEKNIPAIKSDLLDKLRKKEIETGKISILARYGEDFCSRDYITNPAIGRDDEIKELILILLTPEKSGILVGKPGIGKTAIVEGLAYRLQRNLVPDVLKGYCIISVKTTSLLGALPNGETRLQTLIDEIKDLDKIILFIDEIHMLMGATKESSLDFANMFKESLGRGSIKMIGATTNDEYERYVLRDKAFVRRFQRVDVLEPSREHTIEILMGSLPKLEKNIGVKLDYSEYIKTEIMGFIVDITTEYKRVYGIGSRYPDICLTLLSQAFSQAVFDNRKEVNIFDIRKAIENSKNIYPDVIRKELINFDKKFEKIINEN